MLLEEPKSHHIKCFFFLLFDIFLNVQYVGVCVVHSVQFGGFLLSIKESGKNFGYIRSGREEVMSKGDSGYGMVWFWVVYFVCVYENVHFFQKFLDFEF